MKRYEVKQGTSRATIRAADYYEARERAAQIGFQRPDSIVLMTEPDADRYLAVMAWARLRYTKAGSLVVSVGGVPTTYTKIERAAWGRYMGAA